MSIALGGCLRPEPVKYGITEDTGGHITYILGEMDALSRRGDVALAEIVTRRFDEPALGGVHARAEEWINDKLVIRRIDSGNPRYLAKEELAEDRLGFVRALRADLRAREQLPDIIHAHFADSADVAAHIEREFGIPFVYTAHSLGLDKLSASPELAEVLDERITEEDRAIGAASAIIGSSRDKCERQLMAFPSAQIDRIHRVIPGVRRAAASDADRARARALIAPFLRDPDRPMVLAVARPVAKKNLVKLVEAFGATAGLRDKANLVILAGLRDRVKAGAAEKREVLTDLLDAIDRHRLYGHVAYPPQHGRADVDALYALAADSGGVFANPAKVEPYGLTLIEAATFGLPVVATRVGGPIDILDQLDHGILVDPEDATDIGQAIERLLGDKALWDAKSRNARRHVAAMSWDAYAEQFVAVARDVTNGAGRNRPMMRSLLVSDLDNTLTGCSDGVARLRGFLARHEDFGFVLATGRSLVEARRLVREWNLPRPVAWITSVGSELYVERDGRIIRDRSFDRIIASEWNAEAVADALADLDGLEPQPHYEQRQFKCSYFAQDETAADAVRTRLLARGLYARTVFSHSNLLDVLPIGAGKAAAMRHVAGRLGIPMDQVFAAGDSGNDEDMLIACDNAILVANHAAEVARLLDRPNVYVSRRDHAHGALEGILAHQMRHRGARRSGDVA